MIFLHLVSSSFNIFSLYSAQFGDYWLYFLFCLMALKVKVGFMETKVDLHEANFDLFHHEVSLQAFVVVKQIKVGFMKINFGFHEANFDFQSHQAEQEVQPVITELRRVQGEDIKRTRDQMQENHWNRRESLL